MIEILPQTARFNRVDLIIATMLSTMAYLRQKCGFIRVKIVVRKWLYPCVKTIDCTSWHQISLVMKLEFF